MIRAGSATVDFDPFVHLPLDAQGSLGTSAADLVRRRATRGATPR